MKTKISLSLLLLILATQSRVFSQVIPAYADTNGLVAWYAFKGNANDISGKGNNGTLYGSPIFKNDRLGQSSEAIYLDGDNDYIAIPRNSSLEPTLGLTINAWITPERMQNIGWRTLICKPLTPGVDPFVSYAIQTSNSSPINNRWQFNLSNGNTGSLRSVLAKNAFPDKDTLMLTAILGNGEMKLYVNGQLDTVRSFTGSIGYAAQGLLIGYSLGGANEYFKGCIDEMAIWNKALSPSQIEKLYMAGGCKPRFPITISKPVLELNETATISSELMPNRNYQWQINPFQLGWMNLVNNSYFTGTKTNVLSLNQVRVNLHNIPVRLIAKSELCNDTSQAKELVVRYCIPDTFYVKGNTESDTLYIRILTGLNQNEQVINRVKVFPNPTSDLLYFKLDKPGEYRAELMGVSGSVLVTTNQSSMDISGLAAGVYTLRILDAKERLISSNKIAIVR